MSPGQLCRTTILAGNRHSGVSFPAPLAGPRLITALQLPLPQPLQPPPPGDSANLPSLGGKTRVKNHNVRLQSPNCRAGPWHGDKGPAPLKAPPADKPSKAQGLPQVWVWRPGLQEVRRQAGRWVAWPPSSKPGKEEAPQAGTGVAIPAPAWREKEKGGGLLRNWLGGCPDRKCPPPRSSASWPCKPGPAQGPLR